MATDSKQLIKFRQLWVGKIVELDGQRGRVDGACDDGHKCDYDARRRAKPTGELIVIVPGVTTQFYWLAGRVTVVEP